MLKLFNSLTRKIEEFKPISPPQVGMYTCGPTVYDFAHIGNFRTYITADILHRTLLHNRYKVKFVMNITDVGHLTGDNVGDADTGEDRMEKSAKKQGKSAWDIAKFYTDAFLKDYRQLNLLAPSVLCRATDHIKEQIVFVQELEKKGFTYKTSDGIYFDTSKFPDYGKLSNLDDIQEGARVEANPEKKNLRDFALWKFTYPNGRSFNSAQDDNASRRQMEWESPWGIGFPGWHIECSAMSVKYLGDNFDIHAGGMDLASTHHPNEIAQTEAITGRQFVKHWVHAAFILVDGKRMSKSMGNNYTLSDLTEKGFDPAALRYLYLQTHYRKELNFTFDALEASQNALTKLKEEIATFKKPRIGCAEYEERFLEAINDDLNMPQALAVLWELIKSDYPTGAKAESVARMDEVFGLNLFEVAHTVEIPETVQKLIQEREQLRREKRFHLADGLRHKIRKMGFDLRDENKKTIVSRLLPSDK